MLIATAGHVDHGKTSLIRALTGVNTDRLEEEARRGLSIELGFAFKEIRESQTFGFIDVPGHQRFMNTMIAGVTGIDLAMLVVAADDGPMPQTREHLQILDLLGVENYLVVISKSDLVDQTQMESTVEQIRTLLPTAPICKVSTKTNYGIDALFNTLLSKAADHKTRKVCGNFRLYIDRVFTKKGAGLVITGTALSGKIRVGDELFLQSTHTQHSKLTAVKVRNIHAQGKAVEVGLAGQRCALNLTGKVSKEDISRGDSVSADASALPSSRLDSRFWFAKDASQRLKHMGRVKVYIGSRKIAARCYVLFTNDAFGQRVQFILESGVIAYAGDRFLVRDDSERFILGGGVVIDPIAEKGGRAKTERLSWLDAIETPNAKTAFETLLLQNKAIMSLRRQKRIWNLTECEAHEVLNELPFHPENTVLLSCKDDSLLVSSIQWNSYKSQLKTILKRWHIANPKSLSISINDLKLLSRQSIPDIIFSDILKDEIRIGEIIQRENHVRLSGHKPQLALRPNKDWERLETFMRQRIPLRSEIEKELGFSSKKIETLTRPKLKSKNLFEIGEKRLALPVTLHGMADLIAELAQLGPFTIIDAKSKFGLGRGPTIEVLEFFDLIKFTTREGNTRSITNLDVAEWMLKR